MTKADNDTRAIGGYFELELPVHEELHPNAVALNCARACLEYVLKSRKWSKLFIPYFTCSSIIEPIVKSGCKYEFYHINEEYLYHTLALRIANRKHGWQVINKP